MKDELALLARLLAAAGVRYAFGVTGSGASLALIGELESRGVRYSPACHEASGAIMAGAVCQFTSTPAVSISIKGPGVANMVAGIAHNYFENNPALSISEAFGAEVPSHKKHKRLNHRALLGSLVKGVASLDHLEERLPALLVSARSEISGPVHLDLALGGTGRSATAPPQGADRPTATGTEDEIARLLSRANRPLVIAGSLAKRREWQGKLAALRIPVFTTASAKGVLDENLAHCAGVFTGEGKELAPESHLLSKADLVLGIGLRNSEVLSPRPLSGQLIIIDEVSQELSDGFEPLIVNASADAASVRAILDQLGTKSWGIEELSALGSRMRASLLGSGWLPATCFEVLNNCPFDYALALDTGSFCTVGEHLWRAAPHRPFAGSSNGRTMGVALPSAVGLAICKRGLPVFCVMGDGGMQAYPAEIKLAIAEKLPLCFVYMTDGRYGSIACAAPLPGASQRAMTPPRPSWVKAVDAMGCEAHAVDSETAFLAVVQGWKRRQPLFVEASFDPEAYTAMTRSLR